MNQCRLWYKTRTTFGWITCKYMTMCYEIVRLYNIQHINVQFREISGHTEDNTSPLSIRNIQPPVLYR